MEQVEIARRNLDLLNEFMQYAFKHRSSRQVPSGAEMVILPRTTRNWRPRTLGPSAR